MSRSWPRLDEAGPHGGATPDERTVSYTPAHPLAQAIRSPPRGDPMNDPDHRQHADALHSMNLADGHDHADPANLYSCTMVPSAPR